MRGSDLIYIVMPAAILLALFVLIAPPFTAARGSGDRRSGGWHSRRQQTQGQIPGHSAVPDAFGSDVAGLSHEQDVATARVHVPSVETIVSGGTAGNANARRVTSQPTGGRSSMS